MNLSLALRVPKNRKPALIDEFEVVSFVGAGGKTTALFQLAREIVNHHSVIVTSTTHLGVWQIPLADRHVVATNLDNLNNFPLEGVILVTGEIEDERTKPVSESILNWLRENSKCHAIPLLIEADGSRQNSLKAPAAHEPPIPEFTNTVVVVAGLGALGKPLTDEFIYRSEIFSQLGGLQLNQAVTPDAVIRMLTHPLGGLKNIPTHARRVALLNQADTPELQSIGGRMAQELLAHFDSVILGSLKRSNVQTFERTAGIILAAGESTRFGAPKQLLDWKGKPFVRQVAETALQAGLYPVVVITGFCAADVESALDGLPVEIVRNPEYPQGQSTSIRAGVQSLSGKVGAAVFLLADQPQIPVDVIRALVESHGQKMQAILAPLVLEDRRANPVLFDRDTFADLMQLTGDVGGRGIFDKHRVEYLPWHDEILLFDVDKPDDYQKLKEME
jgi:molybdenum cofactor cytidylyltransferase